MPQNAIIENMYIYLNNRIIPDSEAMVSVFDHGFLYGDGIYETMRSYNGIVFMLEGHITRLFRSASMIELSIRRDTDAIKTAIYQTLVANSLKNAYIRLTVSRGYGQIGLDPELCKEPTFIVIANEFKDYPESFYENGVRLIIAGTKRNLKEAINPQIKSLNFLNNILAKVEAKKKGAYEALMLNSEGCLAEGTIFNVFFVSNQILCTPSVDCGILDGITRRIVLDLAVKNQIKIKEGRFKKEDIYEASEVFISNTTMEVMPVSMMDEVRYQAGDITKLLRRAYREKVKDYIKNK